MASIERTAYPRFWRLVTARELASLSPAGDEVAWARARARSDEHLLVTKLAKAELAEIREQQAEISERLITNASRVLNLMIFSCSAMTAVRSHTRLSLPLSDSGAAAATPSGRLLPPFRCSTDESGVERFRK